MDPSLTRSAAVYISQTADNLGYSLDTDATEKTLVSAQNTALTALNSASDFVFACIGDTVKSVQEHEAFPIIQSAWRALVDWNTSQHEANEKWLDEYLGVPTKSIQERTAVSVEVSPKMKPVTETTEASLQKPSTDEASEEKFFDALSNQPWMEAYDKAKVAAATSTSVETVETRTPPTTEKPSRIPRPTKRSATATTSEPKTREQKRKPSRIPRRDNKKSAVAVKGSEAVSSRKAPKTKVGFLTAVRGPVYLDGKTPGAENILKFQNNIRHAEFRRPEEKTTKSKQTFSAEFQKRQNDLQKLRMERREEQPVTRQSGPKVSRTSDSLLERPEHKNHKGHMPMAQFARYEFPKTLRSTKKTN